jgi:hypothetical protein
MREPFFFLKLMKWRTFGALDCKKPQQI